MIVAANRGSMRTQRTAAEAAVEALALVLGHRVSSLRPALALLPLLSPLLLRQPNPLRPLRRCPPRQAALARLQGTGCASTPLPPRVKTPQTPPPLKPPKARPLRPCLRPHSPRSLCLHPCLHHPCLHPCLPRRALRVGAVTARQRRAAKAGAVSARRHA